MSGFERLVARFWAAAPGRLDTWKELASRGEVDARAREEIRALIHAMKGEAQMLEIELARDLLEKADAVAKLTGEAYLITHVMRALLSTEEVLRAMSREEDPPTLAATRAELDTLIFSPERVLGSKRLPRP